jgi:hypothetical protein
VEEAVRNARSRDVAAEQHVSIPFHFKTVDGKTHARRTARGVVKFEDGSMGTILSGE